MNTGIDAEYLAIVSDLLKDKSVMKMDDIEQHVDGFSCLDHSIFVSYLSFLMCRRLGLDCKSAARGGLLHDLHLCNWEETNVNRLKRLVIHPHMALANAERFGLNDIERDIIVNHMWPVTLWHMPKSREAAIVSLADKICASAEFVRAHKILDTTHRLSILNRRRLAGVL